ncbi:MAG TPA: SAM-dependent methyltransferase [Terriglobia bacterium]|nr:SAM-dependent methyltransferase [Terriglobia bacterium]
MKELVEKIRAGIQSRGAITFHDFMQMALYCPVYGYYEKESDIIGASGDFFTSPSVGPLFGQLLAFQFSEWLECLEIAQPQLFGVHPSTPTLTLPPQIVEAGAHDAILARDILTWIQQHRPGLFDRLDYWIIEPSAFRRSRQQQTLALFTNKVRWASGFPSTQNTQYAIRNTQYAEHSPSSLAISPAPAFAGIIFSNELLDAMPVHRIGWNAKSRSWFEWGVTLKNDQFVWTRMAALSSQLQGLEPNIPAELRGILPDGFTTEVSPAASEWWRRAASSLRCGKLLAVDYGLEADEFLLPQRAKGTLRAFFRHHPADDLLANPGEQDITAHVNFSALKEVGESCGLETAPLQTQAQFLTGIFAKLSQSKESFSHWTEQQTRQFQTLTHPDHLGRAFRVFIQKRV